MEHPDITAACLNGYPAWMRTKAEDCPELREMYIDERKLDLVEWIRKNHPDLVDEWLESSDDYQQWLNDE